MVLKYGEGLSRRAAEGRKGEGEGGTEKCHPSPARVVSLPTPFITRTLTRTLTLGAGRPPLPLPHPYLGVGEISVFRRIRTRYFLGGGIDGGLRCTTTTAARTHALELVGLADAKWQASVMNGAITLRL